MTSQYTSCGLCDPLCIPSVSFAWNFFQSFCILCCLPCSSCLDEQTTYFSHTTGECTTCGSLDTREKTKKQKENEEILVPDVSQCETSQATCLPAVLVFPLVSCFFDVFVLQGLKKEIVLKDEQHEHEMLSEKDKPGVTFLFRLAWRLSSFLSVINFHREFRFLFLSDWHIFGCVSHWSDSDL